MEIDFLFSKYSQQKVFLDGLSAQSSDNFDTILAGYQQFAETYTNIHQEHRIDLMFQSLFLRLDDKKV